MAFTCQGQNQLLLLLLLPPQQHTSGHLQQAPMLGAGPRKLADKQMKPQSACQ
jgi:hypothetical protein